MKTLLTTTVLASILVVGGIYAIQHVSAQDSQPCVGNYCPKTQGTQEPGKKQKVDQNSQGSEDMSNPSFKKKKQMQGSGNDGSVGDQTTVRRKQASSQQNDNVNVDVHAGVDVAGGKWHFDPSRHQRRRSKSATFRFYYGGYWYAQPYWEVYGISRGRVSCGEGRAIVAERFNRVRVVECGGGTYTYLGRRDGDSYRVFLNARTGRIVGRALI